MAGNEKYVLSLVILQPALSWITNIKYMQKCNLSLKNPVPVNCGIFHLILYLWHHFASLKLYLHWNFTINIINWFFFYKFLVYDLTVA